MAQTLAVYVHVPFCLSICPYCDFDRQATGFDRVDAYVQAVLREIERAPGQGAGAHSVFFGGGTPSLLRAEHVGRVLEQIDRAWPLEAAAEVTLEANPDDASLEKLHGFRAVGVNRVSFGVQSLDDRYLQQLGRRHSSEAARQAAGWAREAGLRLNLDFMFGLPRQSLEHWRATLEQAVALGPDHLSCYLLTLDEKVPMGRDVARGKLVLPEDEALAAMYDLAQTFLPRHGYAQYEISNWARPGEQSRHNLTYWRDEPWIGVGAGAASSFGGRRWKNSPVLERYIGALESGAQPPRQEDETPDLETRLLDFVTLGLRLREGIDPARFVARFGAEPRTVLGAELAWQVDAGYLEWHAGRLRVAAEHQLLTNELLVRLSGAMAAWAESPEAGTVAR